jgi:hypothetical protein
MHRLAHWIVGDEFDREENLKLMSIVLSAFLIANLLTG